MICGNCGQSVPAVARGRSMCEFCAKIPDPKWHFRTIVTGPRGDTPRKCKPAHHNDGIIMDTKDARPLAVAACEVAKIGFPAACGWKRDKIASTRRQTVMYLLRQVSNLSFPTIGAVLLKNHSTVIHAHTHLSNRARLLPDFGAMLARLEREMRAKLLAGESRKAAA